MDTLLGAEIMSTFYATFPHSFKYGAYYARIEAPDILEAKQAICKRVNTKACVYADRNFAPSLYIGELFSIDTTKKNAGNAA